jgi:hypothetical protein
MIFEPVDNEDKIEPSQEELEQVINSISILNARLDLSIKKIGTITTLLKRLEAKINILEEIKFNRPNRKGLSAKPVRHEGLSWDTPGFQAPGRPGPND